MLETKVKRIKRHKKIRSKISGSSSIPRLAVFRSNIHIYGMLIDDITGKTLVAISDLKVGKKGVTKTQKAHEVGKLIAQAAKKDKFKQVIFDRAGYLYHGRVKALAEGAREGGLEF